MNIPSIIGGIKEKFREQQTKMKDAKSVKDELAATKVSEQLKTAKVENQRAKDKQELINIQQETKQIQRGNSFGGRIAQNLKGKMRESKTKNTVFTQSSGQSLFSSGNEGSIFSQSSGSVFAEQPKVKAARKKTVKIIKYD